MAVKRVSWIVLFVVLTVLAASAWFLFGPKRKLPDDPLAIVPADAYAVMYVRIDRVLASEAFKRLLVERGHAEGMQRVQKTCGYNPLERMRDTVVFARPSPEGGLPRFAFAARGELRHDELADCVRKVTGTDRSKLRTGEIEGIITVESSKGSSLAAFVGRDGIIGGDAESVRHAINVLVGKAPSLSTDATLTGLFRGVQQGQDIAAVARVPEDLRPLLRKVSREALAGILSPLGEVSALATNARFEGGKIAGGAMVLAGDATRAQALEKLARSQVDRVLAMPGVGLTPAAGVLRGIQIEAQGDRVTFAGSVKVSVVEALLDLLPALKQLMGLMESASPASSPAPPAASSPEPPSATPQPATP
jgi:hypothetical protein